MSKSLTPKYLRLAIRHHKPISVILEELQCSEDEFYRSVDMLYRGNSRKIKKSIKVCCVEHPIHSSTSNISIDSSENEPNIETQDVEKCEPFSIVYNGALDSLKESEKILSAALIEMEQKRKLLTENYRAELSQLREIQDTVLELRQKLTQEMETVKNIAKKCDDVLAQRKQLNQELRKKRDELSLIRQNIEEMSHITLFVYCDGSVDADTLCFELPSSILSPSSSAINTIVSQLIESEDFELLSTRQLKILAKVKIICDFLSEQGNMPDVVFDEEILQYYFENLTA